MTTISTLTAVLNLNASGFRSGVKQAQGDLGQLEQRAVNTGKRMQRAGGMMTAGITAPLAAMGGMAVKTAADFDQAMQQSIAVMGDVDDAMREDLEATAREVARTTTQSHEEAAESFYFLASAGLDASQAMEAMPQVAAFAEAGQMDMAEATDVATNVMSAYGIEAENMTDVTDVMTATVSSHNQTMEGMSDAFRNAAPAAASMGVEIEELAALTGALGDVGIQGAEAGTALNSIMRRMAKRSGEAGNALDELGIQTTDANGELLPLVDIVEQLEDANMTAAQSSAIFGRQMSAGNALVETGADELRNYQGNIADSENATQEMAETQRETLNAEMQQARSNVADVGVAIGSDLLPMVSTLTGYVSRAAERFQNLSDRQRKTIIVIGGLLAVVGPLLLTFGTMLTLIPTAVAGFGLLAGAAGTFGGVLTGTVIPAIGATYIALGPIGLILAALTAAIGLLALAWQQDWFDMRDRVETAAGMIGRAIQWIIDQINRIPGVDIPVEDAEESLRSLAETSEETADEVEDTTEGSADSISEMDLDQTALEEEFGMSGEAAGNAFTTGITSGAGESGNVTGEITDELLTEFSEDEIQEIFEARDVDAGKSLHGITASSIEKASKEATVTPEMLGISSQEFNALLGGSSAATTGPGGTAPASDLLTPAAGGRTGSGRSMEDLSEAFEDALRRYFDGARLEMILDVIGDRELERIIDDRAEAVFQDVVNS